MKILLVAPIIVDEPDSPKETPFSHGVEIPLGLLSLKAYLNKMGVDCRILDMRVCPDPYSELKSNLNEYGPTIVGLTAFTLEILGAHEIAKIVKNYDNSIVTIIGGIHVSALPVETLQTYPYFDIAVFGEGELTLIELIDALKMDRPLFPIQGVAFRTSDNIHLGVPRPLLEDLDKLPVPDRSGIDFTKYVPGKATFNSLRVPTTGIMAGRGCPYNCFHCSKGVWGKTVRYRSARRIYEEIVECVSRYDIRDFRFFDDILTLPSGPIEELCQYIIEGRLNISFNCYSRIDHVRPDILRLMKQAGCYHIKYGIEFGSENAIKLSNRRTTLKQAQDAVAITRKVGILVKGNFLMGIPGETPEDCEKTIQFAKTLSPDLVSFGVFCLYPGSVFYRKLQDNNANFQNKMMPKDMVVRLVSRAYREFYLRPGWMVQFFLLMIRDRWFFTGGIAALSSGFFSLFRFFMKRLFSKR